jgi:hypothetical protein
VGIRWRGEKGGSMNSILIKSWVDPETDVVCEIRKNPVFGHLLGYILVPPSHSWFRREELGDIQVHGGVTWKRKEVHKGQYVVRVGFDCAHYGDLMPHFPYPYNATGSVYRDEKFVEEEIRNMLLQYKEDL